MCSSVSQTHTARIEKNTISHTHTRSRCLQNGKVEEEKGQRMQKGCVREREYPRDTQDQVVEKELRQPRWMPAWLICGERVKQIGSVYTPLYAAEECHCTVMIQWWMV